MNQYIITEEQLETAENKATNGYGDCMIPQEIIDAIHSHPLSDELAKERDKVLDDIFAAMNTFFGNIPMDAHIIQWAVSKQDSFVTAAMASYLTYRKSRTTKEIK